MTNEDLGTRLYDARRRLGRSQAAVAGLAGISPSYLSELERGLKTIPSRQVRDGLARALSLSAVELVGTPKPGTPGHSSLPEIENALITLRLGDDPDVGDLPPWPQIQSRVDTTLNSLIVDADYVATSERVPGVLRDLHAAYLAYPAYREEALTALLHTYRIAGVITKNLGVRGFPVVAGERAEAIAHRLGDSTSLAFAAWLRGAMEGEQDRTHQYRLSIDAINDLGVSPSGVRHVQAVGMLHLHCALASAAQGAADLAETHLTAARTLASSLPERYPNFGSLYFGVENVGIWHTAIGRELGYGPKVREIEVHPQFVPAPARQAMYWADRGLALIQDKRTRTEGIANLATAERLAPQRMQTNVFVREAVADLLRRRRREATERTLTRLAWKMGVSG